MEQWKDIEGYEGLYQVSNLGNVRSLGRFRNCYSKGHTRETIFVPEVREMQVSNNGNGYLYVSLAKDGSKKNHYVHRLVAEAFLPRVQGKEYVNHLDYNKMNNKVENLEWCTQKENVDYSRQHYIKQHNSTTSTGERYITKKKNRNLFRVCIPKGNVDKCFKDMPSAIAFRNEVLNEINYTI